MTTPQRGLTLDHWLAWFETVHPKRIDLRLDEGSVAIRVRSAEPQVRYNQYVRSIDDLLQYTQATRFQLRHSDRLMADATLAGWLDVRAGTECVLLHGIRYQRRMLKPFCITDVYRRASMQGLPPGFARVEDAMRALIEAGE